MMRCADTAAEMVESWGEGEPDCAAIEVAALLRAQAADIARLRAANEILRSEAVRWRAEAIKRGHRGYFSQG
jgi:hypothetical protein